ncbi:MAG: Tad domain-containing protein [Rhodospirillales bacterium]|nr:Tad domain-containing protein [Rhodospirillales bacterium]
MGFAGGRAMRRARTSWRSRRGAVALWVGLMAPVLTMALGVGIEVTGWSADQVELQRTADLAASAGMMAYRIDANAQAAANAAANVAEINGIAGTTNRSWDATSQTLSDNMITVTFGSGIRVSSDPGLSVTVQQSVPLTVAHAFTSLSSVTVQASAWSELSGGSSTGAQPCLFAMKTAAAGGTGFTTNGYADVEQTGCSIRSNANISVTGSGTFHTGGIYAAGTISIPSWVTTSGTQVPNAGVLSDPYASNTDVQGALTTAASSTGTAVTCTNEQCSGPSNLMQNCAMTGSNNYSANCTLNPGTYGSWSFGSSAAITLNPGLYIVAGNISSSGSTTITGTGVTIVTTGSVNTSGYLSASLSAASPATAVNGAIPGMVMIGSTSGSVALSGSGNVKLSGVVYFPNASFSGTGWTGQSSTSCAEILAGSISTSGSSQFSGSCTSLGATAFGSVAATPSVALVQ